MRLLADENIPIRAIELLLTRKDILDVTFPATSRLQSLAEFD